MLRRLAKILGSLSRVWLEVPVGSGALRNAGALVARTVGRVERGAAWASERVALGNCAAVFARIQGWLAVNVPSLPLEFSVRGGEA